MLIFIKGIVFYALPGALVGIVFAVKIVGWTQDGVSQFAGKTVDLNLNFESLMLGFGASIGLTLAAMVKPIYNSLDMPLRDALDVFRSKVETMQVVFTKVEDMIGLNLNQLVMGMMLSGFGVAIYVIVPYSLLFGQQAAATAVLIGLMIVCKISGVLLTHLFIP